MTAIRVSDPALIREFPTWLELDSRALFQNLETVRRLTLPGAAILAVVKANAYGHGLQEVVRHLARQVTCFGVSTIDEAQLIRQVEPEIPVLLFGIPNRDAEEAAIQAQVTLSVSSVEQAIRISLGAQKLRTPAVIHIKIDTGMGRLGIPAAGAPLAIQQIRSLDMLELEGVYTHFAQGEKTEDPFTQSQLQVFRRVLAEAEAKGIHFAYRHAANSIGIANHRDSHFNLVRPGLMLYGLYPSPLLHEKAKLVSALAWRAKIILTKELNAGESTGYGRQFVAKGNTAIGIVPVGYSHGYPFQLSNKGHVLVRGKRCQVAGRVSMDYIAVDLGQFKGQVRGGELVTLLGRDGNEEVSAETLAEQAGTIPYDLVTRIDPKIPRISL